MKSAVCKWEGQVGVRGEWQVGGRAGVGEGEAGFS